MPNSNWEKTVSAASWKSYIRSKSQSKEDSLLAGTTSFFPSNRQYYFADSSLQIPNKVIRHDFKLKSAYFTVHQDEDKVTFIGQGFGHGVGLCQEGAIRMARLGFKFDDIIHFYYKDVHLVPLRFIWFFKEN
jgi:stage II sporulation protein D